MLRIARSERSGKNHHHRDFGGIARPDFGRGHDSGAKLAEQRARAARAVGYFAARDEAFREADGARNHRTVRQFLPASAIVKRSARGVAAHRKGRRLGGKTLGWTETAAGSGDGAGGKSEDSVS